MSQPQPVPSRMMLQALKGRKKGAQQGHSLLKKKSDALTARFRGMLKELVDTKREMGEELKEAAYSLAKVKRPAVTLKLSSENVAGVKLPIFNINIDSHADGVYSVIGNMGITRGHQVLQASREKFLGALNLLIRLASIQTSFTTLDQEIKMTNRRVNALDNVVIPSLDHGIKYIGNELDEQEREEFCRLKKIQGKKKDKQQAENMLEQQAVDNQTQTIFATKDKDIIF